MESEQNGIRIATVLGTTRPGNYTSMALRIVNEELRSKGVHLDYIDPAHLSLSFPGQEETGDAQKLRERIKDATGVVLATPEYHGSFSSMLKLVIENLGFPSVLSGKPIALLGVAAGRIGAIKSLEQLRGVCSHVGGIVLPAPLSVALVQKVFDPQGHCLDSATEKLLRAVAGNLINYINTHVCPRLTLEAIVRGDFDVSQLSEGP